jgi:hypothetical protein
MQSQAQNATARGPTVAFLLVAAGLLAIQACVLFATGHPPICTCGTLRLWAGDVLGPENSQQLFDWYTPSHLIHGALLYGLLRLIAPRMPFTARLALAIGLEATWEIVENSPVIMARYRQSALAQGYYGDSMINSLFDTLSMAMGFTLARVLPTWLTIALVIAAELFVGYAIRDNLTLNIIQLIHPSEAISRWQSGH